MTWHEQCSREFEITEMMQPLHRYAMRVVNTGRRHTDTLSTCRRASSQHLNVERSPIKTDCSKEERRKTKVEWMEIFGDVIEELEGQRRVSSSSQEEVVQ